MADISEMMLDGSKAMRMTFDSDVPCIGYADLYPERPVG